MNYDSIILVFYIKSIHIPYCKLALIVIHISVGYIKSIIKGLTIDLSIEYLVLYSDYEHCSYINEFLIHKSLWRAHIPNRDMILSASFPQTGFLASENRRTRKG